MLENNEMVRLCASLGQNHILRDDLMTLSANRL